MFIFALNIKNEQILHGDNFAFHTCNLCNVRDFTRTIAQTLHLNNHVHGRSNLLPHR